MSRTDENCKQVRNVRDKGASEFHIQRWMTPSNKNAGAE
jgi:hypothetical protein